MIDAVLGGLPLMKSTSACGDVDMDSDDIGISTTKPGTKLKIDCVTVLLSIVPRGNAVFKQFETNGGNAIFDLDFR